MAATTPAIGVYISGPWLIQSPTGRNCRGSCFTILGRSRRAGLVMRSSGPDAASSSTAATELEEEDWQGSIEVPEGRPSLISALNVEKAFRGIPITDVDHYASLGLQRGCSYDEVSVGYKNKVDELLNKGLEEEKLTTEMGLLKESYSILSSREERRLYDWSLARTDNPVRYSWPSQADITQIESPETPPILQEPEDVGPTRAVGYFFLGWFVLSAVLSILLNR